MVLLIVNIHPWITGTGHKYPSKPTGTWAEVCMGTSMDVHIWNKGKRSHRAELIVFRTGCFADISMKVRHLVYLDYSHSIPKK